MLDKGFYLEQEIHSGRGGLAAGSLENSCDRSTTTHLNVAERLLRPRGENVCEEEIHKIFIATIKPVEPKILC